jgi:hypothetical protein
MVVSYVQTICFDLPTYLPTYLVTTNWARVNLHPPEQNAKWIVCEYKKHFSIAFLSIAKHCG